MRIGVMVLFSVLILAACEEGENLYMYDATVTSKEYEQGSSEPLKIAFNVALNGHEKMNVTCRVKNALRPMWDGLHVGKVVKITKTSTFDYSPEMICGLLNDAKVADVLK